MKKKSQISALISSSLLLASCTSKAIEPVGHDPIPKEVFPLRVYGVNPAYKRYYNYGKKVNIEGRGFIEGAEAFIGNKPCISTRVVSQRLIKCRIPEHAPGKYSVWVMNPDGATEPKEIIPPIEFIDEDQYPPQKAYFDGLIFFEYTDRKTG